MRFKTKQTKEEVKKKDSFESHFKVISFLVLAFIFIIFLQLFRLQVLESSKYKAIADIQYTSEQRSSSGRGVIYAGNGSVLAIDQPSWNVYATLGTDYIERQLFFENKDKFITKVADILEIEEEKIASQIHENFHYFRIATKVSNDRKTLLEEADIFGQTIPDLLCTLRRKRKGSIQMVT